MEYSPSCPIPVGVPREEHMQSVLPTPTHSTLTDRLRGLLRHFFPNSHSAKSASTAGRRPASSRLSHLLFSRLKRPKRYSSTSTGHHTDASDSSVPTPYMVVDDLFQLDLPPSPPGSPTHIGSSAVWKERLAEWSEEDRLTERRLSCTGVFRVEELAGLSLESEEPSAVPSEPLPQRSENESICWSVDASSCSSHDVDVDVQFRQACGRPNLSPEEIQREAQQLANDTKIVREMLLDLLRQSASPRSMDTEVRYER